ncbi:MAG: hypothetical protein SAJ37_01915 [Oscillatoria sp. PMC 1068.18]|nr:hypothetical protein [Oscillatoria sp. PMC 1076.18]MEC4987479.1 hypothetical protein [Oscillatoria sp. PMC 1068.18]
MNYWQRLSVVATIAVITALISANRLTEKSNETKLEVTNEIMLQYGVTIGEQLTENEVRIYTDVRMFAFTNYP